MNWHFSLLLSPTGRKRKAAELVYSASCDRGKLFVLLTIMLLTSLTEINCPCANRNSNQATKETCARSTTNCNQKCMAYLPHLSFTSFSFPSCTFLSNVSLEFHFVVLLHSWCLCQEVSVWHLYYPSSRKKFNKTQYQYQSSEMIRTHKRKWKLKRWKNKNLKMKSRNKSKNKSKKMEKQKKKRKKVKEQKEKKRKWKKKKLKKRTHKGSKNLLLSPSLLSPNGIQNLIIISFLFSKPLLSPFVFFASSNISLSLFLLEPIVTMPRLMANTIHLSLFLLLICRMSGDEVVDGLMSYFDKALGSMLLYRFERIQYAKIIKKLPTTRLSEVCISNYQYIHMYIVTNSQSPFCSIALSPLPLSLSLSVCVCVYVCVVPLSLSLSLCVCVCDEKNQNQNQKPTLSPVSPVSLCVWPHIHSSLCLT